MLTGCLDADRLILSYLSDKDILTFSQINTFTKNKLCDETFFKNLTYNRYKNTVKYKDFEYNHSWKEHFVSVVYYKEKLEKEYKFAYNEKQEINFKMEYLLQKLIEDLPNKGYSSDEEINLLTIASEDGNLSLVQYLNERGEKIEHKTLESASRNGHFHIVKYLIEQIPDIPIDFLERALVTASRGKYLHIVKYLLDCGADVNAERTRA